jgi:SAM-dependent methyltransferase
VTIYGSNRKVSHALSGTRSASRGVGRNFIVRFRRSTASENASPLEGGFQKGCMKTFELEYLMLESFMPPLHRKARQEIRALARAVNGTPEILDVGGRKSHYTIGVNGHVTVTDLPRVTPIQRALNLGLTMDMRSQLFSRRSNLNRVIFDDMTNSHLPDEQFDLVVAIEVLEHVEEDEQFVSEVRRVMKTGASFLMTTPNGDFVENTNPDHKRHYRREGLADLLSRHLHGVRVEYAVLGGPYYKRGLRSWSLRHPLRTLNTMLSASISGMQSANQSVASRAEGTHQLIAWACK